METYCVKIKKMETYFHVEQRSKQKYHMLDFQSFHMQWYSHYLTTLIGRNCSFNFVSLNDMSIFLIWQIWKACVRGQLWEWIWCCLWLIIFTSFPLSRSWTKKPISLFGSFTSDQFLQNLWKLTDYLWLHSSRCVFLCISANQITKCCSTF